MLINQIQQTKFSESEAVIMRYVLSQGEAIATKTCQDIADATFTSAPLTIRIAKKLGFSGWNDFKKAFIEELNYLETHQEVDASIPFVITDDPMSIAGNIIRLHEETVKDTRELLHHDEVTQAVSLLRKAKVIDIYTTSDYFPQAMTFKNRMNLDDMVVNIACDEGTMSQMIAKSDPTHLSIIISYSGETKSLLRVLKWVRHKKVPVLAMTSISRSTLSKNADVVWHMSSREMVNTKISYFASAESLSCLLDILYGCLFSFDYNKHLDQVFYMTEITNDKYTEDPYIDDSKMGQYE